MRRWEATTDVVCAAFGFYRDSEQPHRYRDFFRDSEFDPIVQGSEVSAAFNLSMLALEQPPSLADRIVERIRTKHA